jgi:hypothetical protein
VSGRDGECIYQVPQDMAGTWQQQPLQGSHASLNRAQLIKATHAGCVRIYTVVRVMCTGVRVSRQDTVAKGSGRGIRLDLR